MIILVFFLKLPTIGIYKFVTFTYDLILLIKSQIGTVLSLLHTLSYKINICCINKCCIYVQLEFYVSYYHYCQLSTSF